MGKFKIAKQFDFCYGHRVWSQTLNSEYSLDSCLKCRHLHGHQGTIVVFLEADELTDGMVTDFKHLNWFKKWLDDTLDHKFIMDINDPLFNHEVKDPIMNMMDNFSSGDLLSDGLINYDEGFSIIKPEWYGDLITPIREKYEGMVFVKFVPTSENLSKWIFDIIQARMKPLGVKVSQVQYYETPKSQSNYYSE